MARDARGAELHFVPSDLVEDAIEEAPLTVEVRTEKDVRAAKDVALAAPPLFDAENARARGKKGRRGPDPPYRVPRLHLQSLSRGDVGADTHVATE